MKETLKGIIGRKVHVIVDRPLNSTHPQFHDVIYPINYGYIEGIFAGDGECQDCYILGEKEPITAFDGVVIAIIHRLNDVENKWIVAKEDMDISDQEILEAVAFQERYFQIKLLR